MDRRAILMVLLVALFLAPIVGASLLPDPTWIGGVYDDGDGDAVAILVWDRTAAVVPGVVAPIRPPGSPLAGPASAQPSVSRPLPRSASRAPPRV